MTTYVKHFSATFGVPPSTVVQEDACGVGLFGDLGGLGLKKLSLRRY